MKRKGRVIQPHHLVYSHPDHPTQLEMIEFLFKGEHFAISRINQMARGEVSKGFMKCLKFFIAAHEDRAVELRPEENN